MNWFQRIKRYLNAFDYELLGFEGGLVFWKDESGRVWGSAESAITRSMNDWEMKK